MKHLSMFTKIMSLFCVVALAIVPLASITPMIHDNGDAITASNAEPIYATAETATAESADETYYGKLELTETGTPECISISAPDGWTLETIDDGVPIFSNDDAIVGFASYRLPRTKHQTLELMTEMLSQAVGAEKKYYMTDDGMWYRYEVKDEDLTTGHSWYYMHIDTDKGDSYATVVSVYIPEKYSNEFDESKITDFLATCEFPNREESTTND